MTITLKTLGQATAQEVFDQVSSHLLTQMKKSINPKNPSLCVYHADSGLKCAAGCLISDDEYTPRMAALGWDLLCEIYDKNFTKHIKQIIVL